MTGITALCYSRWMATLGLLPESFGSVPKSTVPADLLWGFKKSVIRCPAHRSAVAGF
jgi:hypothetical protein